MRQLKVKCLATLLSAAKNPKPWIPWYRHLPAEVLLADAKTREVDVFADDMVELGRTKGSFFFYPPIPPALAFCSVVYTGLV